MDDSGRNRHPAGRVRGPRYVRAPGLARWGLVLLGLAPLASMADWTVTPYAAESLEYNSNIFDLNKEGPEPEGKDGPTFADTYLRTRAGVDATYAFGLQKFFGTAEFSRFDYDNFGLLDHNENLLDAGLNWKLPEAIDGVLEASHAERMVQFLDLTAATQLIIERENFVNASFNVDVTPDWRLETKARDHDLDSPRADLPGLSLHEDSILEGLRYLGVSNLSAGVEVQYLQGEYHDDPTALDPRYHQVGIDGAATYVISGLTNFNGSLGYTKRTDPSAASLSGLTGSLSYQHSLSGKTTLNLQVGRNLSTYITTGGNEVDTSASAAVTWQATYKTSFKAGYSYVNSKFPGTPDGAIFIDRVDHFQTLNLDMQYQVIRWLQIHPYIRYQTRSSNDETYSFNGTIIGIEVLAKRPPPNQAAR